MSKFWCFLYTSLVTFKSFITMRDIVWQKSDCFKIPATSEILNKSFLVIQLNNSIILKDKDKEKNAPGFLYQGVCKLKMPQRKGWKYFLMALLTFWSVTVVKDWLRQSGRRLSIFKWHLYDFYIWKKVSAVCK